MRSDNSTTQRRDAGSDARRRRGRAWDAMWLALAVGLGACTWSAQTVLAAAGPALPIVVSALAYPAARPLLDRVATLLTDNDDPLTLRVAMPPNRIPDTRDVPLRARLVTPTRFVAERLEASDSSLEQRIIIGRLQLPADSTAHDDSDTQTSSLAALVTDRLPPGVVGPEPLLLTTAAWRLADNPAVYRRLLRALDRAVAAENAARADAAQAAADTDSASSSFYSLSMDWSLVTLLQLRLAWYRELNPAFADRERDILAWIVAEPLADVAPRSVDRILLDARVKPS